GAGYGPGNGGSLLIEAPSGTTNTLSSGGFGQTFGYQNNAPVEFEITQGTGSDKTTFNLPGSYVNIFGNTSVTVGSNVSLAAESHISVTTPDLILNGCMSVSQNGGQIVLAGPSTLTLEGSGGQVSVSNGSVFVTAPSSVSFLNNYNFDT